MWIIVGNLVMIVSVFLIYCPLTDKVLLGKAMDGGEMLAVILPLMLRKEGGMMTNIVGPENYIDTVIYINTTLSYTSPYTIYFWNVNGGSPEALSGRIRRGSPCYKYIKKLRRALK